MSAYQLEFEYEGLSGGKHLFVGHTGLTPVKLSHAGREVIDWCKAHLGPGWKYVVLREGREEVQFARAAGQYKESLAVGAFLGTKHFPQSRSGMDGMGLHLVLKGDVELTQFKLAHADHFESWVKQTPTRWHRRHHLQQR